MIYISSYEVCNSISHSSHKRDSWDKIANYTRWNINHIWQKSWKFLYILNMCKYKTKLSYRELNVNLVKPMVSWNYFKTRSDICFILVKKTWYCLIVYNDYCTYLKGLSMHHRLGWASLQCYSVERWRRGLTGLPLWPGSGSRAVWADWVPLYCRKSPETDNTAAC